MQADPFLTGRSTLLGDAAHAMYPIGSNGASQGFWTHGARERATLNTRVSIVRDR